MKKLKFLLVLLLALAIIPFGVFAEEEGSSEEQAVEENATEEKTDDAEDSKKVNIYFFRGEGCSHCAETEEWFESIKDEYSKYYNLKDYETWYDEKNNDLMERVADARGEKVEGVPYIIIGDKSWNGFTDEYKDEILAEIKSQYEKDVDDRYDIMKLLPSLEKKEDDSSSDFVALILILVITGAVVGGIIYSRKHTE